MPTVASEFSTLQRSGPYINNPDARWTFIPQTKALRGGLTPHAWALKYYGLTWTEMRSIMRYMITNPVGDATGLVPQIREKIIKRGAVPFRSGKLLDTILQTMWIDRSQWYSSHFYVDLIYEWAIDRPTLFASPVHAPPDKGRGKDYIPINPTVSGMQQKLSPVSPKGYVLYGLNDPHASTDPRWWIEQDALPVLEDDFASIFNFVLQVEI